MKANILVLDDEESIRFSFHRFLAAEGHHVSMVASYGEALARMDEKKFHLILADIILGDGFGINILREVLRRTLKTRVIIMTAYPTPETVQLSSRLHAADYLVKPLRQQGLLAAVKKALEHLESVGDDDLELRRQSPS